MCVWCDILLESHKQIETKHLSLENIQIKNVSFGLRAWYLTRFLIFVLLKERKRKHHEEEFKTLTSNTH